jgi:predicted nucleic acid-binding protein
MPDLANIPSGSSVFVDTNIFVYHFTGRSPSCTAFFRRIAAEDIKAYVNTEVLSDLLHRLMLAEAHHLRLIRRANPSDMKTCLQFDRTAIQRLPHHQEMLESVWNMGTKILNVTKTLLVKSKRERYTHGLMTNDSLHLGSMVYHRNPIANIATNDKDFTHIPGIIVWEPADVIY